jgi:hypothetical protein
MCIGFNSWEFIGERVLKNHEISTSLEPSIRRDAWRAIIISLTRYSKRSKGKFMKIMKHEIPKRFMSLIEERSRLLIVQG